MAMELKNCKLVKLIINSSNGDFYEGTWKSNQMVGQGNYTFQSGAHYEGEFLNSFRHGRGTYTL